MQKLTDRLDQSWQAFYHRWKCQAGENYGKQFVTPMGESLAEFEISADRLMDAALELDRDLRNFERQEGIYL